MNYKCIHVLLIHGIVKNKLKDNNRDFSIVNRVAFAFASVFRTSLSAPFQHLAPLMASTLGNVAEWQQGGQHTILGEHVLRE